MSEDKSDYADMPSGRIAQLKYSIGNLWDDFGRTDSLSLAVVVNVGMVLVGLVVFALTDGLLAFAGVVWAIFNAYPLIQWVFGL